MTEMYYFDSEGFARRLNDILWTKRLRVPEAAAQAGVSYAIFHRILKHRGTPNADAIVNLLRFMGADFKEFVVRRNRTVGALTAASEIEDQASE
ncbi:MAG TPA: hypothetical protein VFE62_26195 [Gemmataceae bacterium]|nr:hypothetical protein [Gemmataceae bacterium]